MGKRLEVIAKEWEHFGNIFLLQDQGYGDNPTLRTLLDRHIPFRLVEKTDITYELYIPKEKIAQTKMYLNRN